MPLELWVTRVSANGQPRYVDSVSVFRWCCRLPLNVGMNPQTRGSVGSMSVYACLPTTGSSCWLGRCKARTTPSLKPSRFVSVCVFGVPSTSFCCMALGRKGWESQPLPTCPPQELSDSRLALQRRDQELRHVGRRLQQVEEERQLQMQQLQGTQNALQQAIR